MGKRILINGAAILCSVALLFSTGSGNTTDRTAEGDLHIDAKSFRCITKMTPVRQFYVDNLRGNLRATLAAANSTTGAVYPPASVIQLVPGEAMVKREKGKLDIVFANAGAAKYAPFGKITEEHYDSIFNINVKGLLFTVQKALPLMPDGASIILNASIVASKGLSANSVYSATKAAVRSFARTWTTDLKDRRIRVNAVSPGFTDTAPWHSIEAAEERMKAISSSIPLGRFGTPDEIAKAVVFLASDDSSYITVTELFVDGGFAQV